MKQLHPLLPATSAAEYAFRAGVALERRGHLPGLELGVANEATAHVLTLDWEVVGNQEHQQLDQIRVTEDGAEAVALVIGKIADSGSFAADYNTASSRIGFCSTETANWWPWR